LRFLRVAFTPRDGFSFESLLDAVHLEPVAGSAALALHVVLEHLVGVAVDVFVDRAAS